MNLTNILEKEKQNRKEFASSARNAITLCMFACALMLALQIALSFLPLPSGNEVYDAVSDMIIYCGSICIPTVILSYCFKHFFKDINIDLPKRNNPKKPFLYIAGTLGVGYLTNLIIISFFTDFFERHAIDSGAPTLTIIGIILMYLTNAVLPAIIEEWAFRGVICKNLIPYNKAGAIILSSLLFGFMHINPTTIVFTSILGSLLAVCYVYSGSLKLPMLIHLLNNGIATTFTIFIDTENPNSASTLISYFIVIVMIGFSIYGMIYYGKNGITQKKISLKKPLIIGYKLSIVDFLTTFLLNAGIIPLFYTVYFIYDLIY